MTIRAFRRPSRSLRAPITRVVTVAVTALQATMAAIMDVSPEMVLYRNTLKYIFSMTQAICPNRPKVSRAARCGRPVWFSCYRSSS